MIALLNRPRNYILIRLLMFGVAIGSHEMAQAGVKRASEPPTRRVSESTIRAAWRTYSWICVEITPAGNVMPVEPHKGQQRYVGTFRTKAAAQAWCDTRPLCIVEPLVPVKAAGGAR